MPNADDVLTKSEEAAASEISIIASLPAEENDDETALDVSEKSKETASTSEIAPSDIEERLESETSPEPSVSAVDESPESKPSPEPLPSVVDESPKSKPSPESAVSAEPSLPEETIHESSVSSRDSSDSVDKDLVTNRDVGVHTQQVFPQNTEENSEPLKGTENVNTKEYTTAKVSNGWVAFMTIFSIALMVAAGGFAYWGWKHAKREKFKGWRPYDFELIEF